MEAPLKLPELTPPEPRHSRLELDPRLPAGPEFSGGPDARRPIGSTYSTTSAPTQAGVIAHLHFVDYLKVLHRRRWIAINAFLLVFGLAVVYTFTATPQFEGRAQVLIENEEANVVAFQQVVEENRQTLDYYQTQYRLLQSRALDKRTLESAALWNDPLFAEAQRSWLQRFVLWVRERILGSEIPDPSETAAQARGVDAYLRRLRVAPIRNSRLVDVIFITPDPVLSARVANAHAAAYIEQNLEYKFLASKEASDWLAARLGEQRQQVEQTEQALQKYREQTGAVALEDRQNIVIQRLTDLNAAVTRARTERIEKEALFNQIRSIQGDRNALDTFPAILSNSFIQQLKAELNQLQRQQAELAQKLGARHPDMVRTQSAIETMGRRIDAEIQKVIQAVRNDYEAALASERNLTAALDQQRAEAQQLNRASIQYGALQRDAQSNRQLFEGLLQRAKETGVSSDLRTNNIRVVDAAEPPRRPSSPNRPYNLAFGLLSGLLLGVALAFFTEYLDGRLKSPEEIRTHLGLPCLGIIPVMKSNEPDSDPLLSGAVEHVFAEAVKSVRTNLLFSTTEESSRVVVITSTGPGEGKTVVAANIAISLAQVGQRVLLVDCDMRRSRVHTVFGFKHEPGLSNLMVGNAKASDAVRKTSTQNLWILPSGKHPPNPAELLASARFRDFMKSLVGHFDWIVLDSPPVMAATDAVVAAHNADGVVFVIGAEMTDRRTARHALDMLESGKSKFFGAVLNKVDLERNRFYYSTYYRRDYSNYYSKSGPDRSHTTSDGSV
jgi:capsular exopolysaccharide synthesis family protein